MSEHTQGPWEFDGCVQIVEVARPHMRVCFLPSDHERYVTSKPNGYLIAAAPELLAELRTSPCPRPSNAAPDDLTVDQCMARNECGCSCGAAIAKAEGLSQTSAERTTE